MKRSPGGTYAVVLEHREQSSSVSPIAWLAMIAKQLGVSEYRAALELTNLEDFTRENGEESLLTPIQSWYVEGYQLGYEARETESA